MSNKTARRPGIVSPTPDKIGETLVEAIKKAGIYEKCLVK